MSSLKFIISQRGKELLVLNKFKYRYHKRLSGGVKRWTCSNSGSKRCSAYLKTGENKNIVEIFDKHNHPPIDEQILNRNEISNSLKRKASDNLGERPMKLIHQELRQGDVETLSNYDIKRIRKNLYQARKSVLAKLPRSQAQVHHDLKSYPVKTNEDESFLLVKDEKNDIFMFSCQKNLEFLCTLETIYVDGTFNCCANFFLQMFSIKGLVDGNYIPLVFFLLPNKQKTSYTLAFNYAMQECRKFGKIFEPTTVVAGFEEAMHRSVSEIWENTKIVGCGLPFLDPKDVGGDSLALDLTSTSTKHSTTHMD